MSLARRRLILGCAAAAANTAAVPIWAEPASNTSSNNWPSKTIAIVVPFPAGGSADLSARLLAEHLKTVLGQPVVVENKPGAGGNLAAAEAARAQGDGHTLFIDQPKPVSASILQSVDRFYRDRHDVVSAAPRCCSSGHTGAIAGQLYRSRTRASGRAQLWLVRNRFVDPPLRRDVQGAHRDRHGPRALSRPSCCARRSDWRSNCGDVSDCAGRHCVHTGRDSVRRSAHAAARLFRSHRVGLGALYAPAPTPASIVERLRAQLDALLGSDAFIERMKQVGVEVEPKRLDDFVIFAQQERRRWAKLIESLKLQIE